MNLDNPESRAQIIFFSHGGGPMPILGDPGHQAMIDFMRQLPARIRKPKAILVISAHWEESAATLMGAEHPALFYDYYGFPEQAYNITYPAPGSPEYAQRIAGLLKQNHIPTRIDLERGFDHGLFIPLKMMYPLAEIPALQLSLVRGLNPSVHLALGKALGELASENLLVIGSGSSFHNLRRVFQQPSATDPANDAFQDWLIETCTGSLSSSEREQRLLHWEGAPSARYCHPREEHLMPLHVCYGMADKPAQVIFDDQIFGKRNLAFMW
jgi:4,5-DOPA dioxygenase extradiol